MKVNCLLISAALQACAASSQTLRAAELARVTGDWVNVRGLPSVNSEILSQLAKGETVTVCGEITSPQTGPGVPAKWARISLPAKAAVWVKASYVNAGAVTASILNARSGPGEQFVVLAQLPRGEKVRALSEKAGWLQIEPPAGATAYVAADFLAKIPSAPAASPTPVQPMTSPDRVGMIAAAPASTRRPAAPAEKTLPVVAAAPVVKPIAVAPKVETVPVALAEKMLPAAAPAPVVNPVALAPKVETAPVALVAKTPPVLAPAPVAKPFAVAPKVESAPVALAEKTLPVIAPAPVAKPIVVAPKVETGPVALAEKTPPVVAPAPVTKPIAVAPKVETAPVALVAKTPPVVAPAPVAKPFAVAPKVESAPVALAEKTLPVIAPAPVAKPIVVAPKVETGPVALAEKTPPVVAPAPVTKPVVVAPKVETAPVALAEKTLPAVAPAPVAKPVVVAPKVETAPVALAEKTLPAAAPAPVVNPVAVAPKIETAPVALAEKTLPVVAAAPAAKPVAVAPKIDAAPVSAIARTASPTIAEAKRESKESASSASWEGPDPEPLIYDLRPPAPAKKVSAAVASPVSASSSEVAVLVQHEAVQAHDLSPEPPAEKPTQAETSKQTAAAALPAKETAAVEATPPPAAQASAPTSSASLGGYGASGASVLAASPELFSGVVAQAPPAGAPAPRPVGDREGTQALVKDPGENMNRFGMSYRVGYHISASISRMASVPSRITLAPVTDQNIARDYDDGYVKPDSRSNRMGLTWNWGYSDKAAFTPNVALELHTYSGSFDAEAQKLGNNDPQHGFEFTYNRQISHLGGKYDNGVWGFLAGFSRTDFSIRDTQTLPGTLNTTTDTYLASGIIYPPPPGYKGSFEGPGALIDANPQAGLRTGSSTSYPALIAGRREFNADIYGLRLGPYGEVPIGKYFSASLSVGLALGVVESELQYDNTLDVPGTSVRLSQSSRSSDSGILTGWYFDANVDVPIYKSLSAIGGFQFQSMDRYAHTQGFDRVELNARSSFFLTVGLGYSF